MKYLITGLWVMSLFVPTMYARAFSGSEVHILQNGTATISGTKVMQVAGTTLFTRMYWGDSYVRLTVKTNGQTKILRGTGEVTTLSEIAEGNLLNVSGQLDSGSDILTLTATKIENSSVQKKQNVFAGRVTNVDPSARSFVLKTKTGSTVTIQTNESTQFKKGSRTLNLSYVQVGDYVSQTGGDYDLPTKTLTAQSVVIYIDPLYYKPKNFQGTIQQINSTTTPVSLVLVIDNKPHTVFVGDKTTVLNKNRGNVSINRFVVGDTVRVFGALREIDELQIDADIIRNINL